MASEGFGADDDVIRVQIAGAKLAGDFIARRTKQGQKEAERKGEETGQPKHRGSAKEGGGRPSAEQGDPGRRIFRPLCCRARARREKSDRAIAEAFNKRGYIPAHADAWTQENVRRMRLGMQSEGASAAPGQAKGEIERNPAPSDEGRSPAPIGPPVGPQTGLGSPSGLSCKHPDPGHPEGAIVGYNSKLTATPAPVRCTSWSVMVPISFEWFSKFNTGYMPGRRAASRSSSIGSAPNPPIFILKR